MTDLMALWLPILLSAVIVFVVSSIIHMAMPWHKNEYPQVPDENRFMEAVRPLAIPPGDYMVPRCNDMKEMKTPAFADKLAKGPVMIMTVLPNGMMSMTRSLTLWFVYLVVTGLFAGYVASRALPPGADYLRVFQLVGASAFMAYAFGLWQMNIWYHRSMSTTVKSTFDSLIYALLTAGTFGWLWPHLAA